jgi:methionyl-tRNA formyltransferase
MQKLLNKVVFMGSPDYVIPVMAGLARDYTFMGVVTQPDRETGRNRVLKPTPVKVAAEEMGIECIQPEKLNTEEFICKLQNWNPEVVVVAAYGKIIPEKILNLPGSGFINIHTSLLPRWRGASPIQATILNGDEISGVTIMKIDRGLDTGPIIAQCEVPVNSDDTTASLRPRLFDSGTDLLLNTLPEYLNGSITPRPQIESQATYAKVIKKSDGELNFNESAELIHRKIRAYNPWPICYLQWQDNPMRIFEVVISATNQLKPGQKGIIDRYPAIGTDTYDILLTKVQVAGKRVVDGRQFLNGARNWLS